MRKCLCFRMFDDATAFELPANAPWYNENEADQEEFMW